MLPGNANPLSSSRFFMKHWTAKKRAYSQNHMAFARFACGPPRAFEEPASDSLFEGAPRSFPVVDGDRLGQILTNPFVLRAEHDSSHSGGSSPIRRFRACPPVRCSTAFHLPSGVLCLVNQQHSTTIHQPIVASRRGSTILNKNLKTNGTGSRKPRRLVLRIGREKVVASRMKSRQGRD